MGNQQNKFDRRQGQLGANHKGLPESIPELFRFIACDITPEDEVHAEIESWPSNRLGHVPVGGFEPQMVDRRRPQPGTPARQSASALAHGEGGAPMQTPPRAGRGHGPAGASSPGWQQDSDRGGARAGPYKVGDLIELWSKSQQAWCRGSVDKVEGNWVHVAYAGPEGQPMTKIMPNGHEELRVPGAAQGNENTDMQNVPNQTGQQPSHKGSWDMNASTPSSAPPPPPPPPRSEAPAYPGQGPNRYPLHALHNQPGSDAGYEFQPAPEPTQPSWDSGGGLFNLPALSMPDFLKGTSQASTPDVPGSFGGQTDYHGSMRFQQPQMQAMQFQGFQGQSQQGWQAGLCHSPSQPQSLSVAPGAMSPGGGSCAAPSSAYGAASPGSAAGSCAVPAFGQTPPRKKYQEADIANRVPLVAGVERIEPEDVHRMLQGNACALVDLRGDDRAVGLIPGSIHIQAIDATPFAQKIPGMLQRFQNLPLVVFTCQYSAHRAPQCANWYREQADGRQRVAIMSGGFRGWEGTGLPVETTGSGDKYAADAYALLQGVQFTHKPAPAAGGLVGSLAQRWV